MGLKGISPIISPELLKALAMMGHGDEIVLADAHFPGTACSKTNVVKIIRCDGHGIPELLSAILKLFPLDTYVDSPVTLMDLVESDKDRKFKPTVWKTYENIINTENKSKVEISFLERFSFYERAKKAFVIVQTSEKALYGNVILMKGIIPDEN